MVSIKKVQKFLQKSVDAFPEARIVMCSAGNAKPRGGAKLWKHLNEVKVRGTQDAPREPDS